MVDRLERYSFRVSGNSPGIKILNTIIFAMKYLIYRCRGKSVILSLGEFQKELLEFREEENNIAGRAGK